MKARNKKNGQAIIGAVLFLLLISSIVVFGLARSVFNTMKNGSDMWASRGSYYTSEALAEDVVYRLMNGMTVSGSSSLSLDGYSATATLADTASGKEIISSGSRQDFIRNVRLELSLGTGASFFYGLQVGAGGLNMSNTSSVRGNVYSDGPVSGSGNYIYGDVLSSGPAGLINNIHATSSAYAHTIQNATVDKDAYFQAISNTTVGGVKYANSPDQATTSLPISDEQIAEWEQDAASGGSVTCTNGTYSITANMTIGPKKIPCNLSISGSGTTVTLTGAIWVLGNISISNSSVIQISPSILNRAIPVIADNQADEVNSGTVTLSNSVTFKGSGDNSYVLMVSMNSSAEHGGGILAIDLRNTASGDVLLYSPHGNVSVGNNLFIREVTGYEISLSNSAQIIYKSGLASLLFASGPGGGYKIYDWREVQ